MNIKRTRKMTDRGLINAPRMLLGMTVLILALIFSGASAFAQSQEPPQPKPSADLGDAPDSTNHHGMNNTAYPGVPGRFPTVFEGTPAGEGRGPIHHHPRVVWLGDKVSLENEADIGPDEEMDAGGNPINNILAKGVNNANNDRGDDGWLNRNVVLADCQQATLKVRVRKDPVAAANMKQVFLNVWIDGNRDGDWADLGTCPQNQTSNEWIVRNFAVDLTSFSGDFQDIEVKTLLVSNAKPDVPAWMRFTLSDEQAVLMPVDPTKPGISPLADGRGPDNGFNIGETEDYLYLPKQVDQIRPDFGDAPDSTNHYGLTNPAYPATSTAGRFPSVWEGTPAGQPSGPMHANPYNS